MGKQENLDDFLRKNLENDSIFEYNEADWLKAEKLIAGNSNTRVAAFKFKKIIGIFSVILALLVVVFNYKFSNNDNTVKVTSNSNTLSNQSIDNSLPSESNKLLMEDNSKNNEEIIKKSNSIQNKTKNVINHTNIKKQKNQNANHNNKISKNESKLMQNDAKSVSIDNDDYATTLNRKTNVFEKLNSLFVSKSYYQTNNSRKSEIIKYLNNDSTLNGLENANNDFAENKVDVKIKKPFAIDAFVGLALNKQFKGNIKHLSTPSLDPFVGIAMQFYINKKIRLGSNIAYSQRRGINNSYINFNDNGDSDYVSINKIFALELPIYASYILDKHNMCYGGVGAMFYLSNQSDILKASGAAKLDEANGIISTDAFILLGYKYKFNNNVNVFLNAQIGLRDVTKNQIFKSSSHDDNVSLRFGIGYSIFDRKY